MPSSLKFSLKVSSALSVPRSKFRASHSVVLTSISTSAQRGARTRTRAPGVPALVDTLAGRPASDHAARLFSEEEHGSLMRQAEGGRKPGAVDNKYAGRSGNCSS